MIPYVAAGPTAVPAGPAAVPAVSTATSISVSNAEEQFLGVIPYVIYLCLLL